MPNELSIIVVDDTPMNLFILDEMAQSVGIKVVCFEDPTVALTYIQSHRVDIAFIDYMMPKIDGIVLIKALKEHHPEALSVMVTAVNDNRELKLSALREGATDFLTKPIDMAEFQAKLLNLSHLKQLQNRLEHFNTALQHEVEKATRELVEREYETLKVLSKTAEYRDPETSSHIARVAHYSKLLAQLSGLSEEEQEIVFHASPLHDTGKVGIPDTILLKPAKLSDEEYRIMQQHAFIGYNILKGSQNPYLKAGAIIAHEHHEKFDGSGYPRGLKGEEIHLYGRITAIADVFDALTSKRPYKVAWSFEEALSFLQTEAGVHFDPQLVTLFIENQPVVHEIYTRYKEE